MRASTLLGLSLVLLGAGCRRVPAEVATTTPSEPVGEQPADQPVVIEKPGPEPTGGHAIGPVDSIADFDTFLGLRRGDTFADVLSKFGDAPYQELGADSGLDTHYYFLVEDTDPDDGPPNAGDDFLLVVTVDRSTGWVFNLEITLGDLSLIPVSDPRLDLLGLTLDQITAKFGPPVRESSGFNTYEHVDENDELLFDVEFVCYDHDAMKCTELWVTWYEPEAEAP